MQYRNTPLRGSNKSPAELALGRKLKDTIHLPANRYTVDVSWVKSLEERSDDE